MRNKPPKLHPIYTTIGLIISIHFHTLMFKILDIYSYVSQLGVDTYVIVLIIIIQVVNVLLLAISINYIIDKDVENKHALMAFISFSVITFLNYIITT